jgi:hypothetical protein
MKNIFIAIAVLFMACAHAENKYSANTPFTIDEWNSCFIECNGSMPLNLRQLGFSQEEIDKLDVNTKCVMFCRRALYQKRGVAVD